MSPKASDRSFGMVFAAVFTIVGLWPVLGGGGPRPWALLLAFVFSLVAVAAPWLLHPMNIVWLKFGALLHHLMTPIVMAVVFFIVIVPIGVLMRAMRKDPLRLNREMHADSYWIEREEGGPDPRTMTRQF